MREYAFTTEHNPWQVCSVLNNHPEWNVVSITAKTERYTNCAPETVYVIFYYIIK